VLERFLDRLDAWAEQEDPSTDLRILVTSWIMTRYDDPYQGVQRAEGFENLWFGADPTLTTASVMPWSARTGSKRPAAPSAATASPR